MFNRILFSKIFAALLVVGLAAGSLSGVAAAQGIAPVPEDSPSHTGQRGGQRGIGQITAIEPDSIRIQTRQGDERTIYVDEDTRYRNTLWEELNLSDFQVGDWAAGTASYDGSGKLVAKIVILLPEDYDPTQRLGRRARGMVLEVNTQGETFTLQARNGEQLEFVVNENTLYRGRVESLADLEPGMLAAVSALKQSDGELLAISISARPVLLKFGGRIVAVDLAGSYFTLDTPRQDELLVHVDDNTRFRSRGGVVQGLEDLEPGMLTAVAGLQEQDGRFLARTVGVGRLDP